MHNEHVMFAVVCILTFVIYAATSSPDLGLVDSGELTTVAWSVGIAHPTGYPLYVLAGRLWLALCPGSAARGMVLFSVLLASMATGLMGIIAARLLTPVGSLSRVWRTVVAGVLAMAFALSRAAWTSISFAEVYPLTWFIAALLFCVCVRIEHLPRDRTWLVWSLLACYLWGLGLGNHFTIIWLMPITALVVLRTARASSQPRRIAVAAAVLFAAGASVNLFLPIRSSVEPALDWSDPQTLPNLLRHLTAWQYHVWMFTGGWAAFTERLMAYVRIIPTDIGWAMTALACMGSAITLRRRHAFGLAALLTWVLGVAYNVNYDIPDISTYFLLFYVPLFVLATIAFGWLISSLARWRFSPVAVSAAAVAMALAVSWSGVASAGSEGFQSRNRFARTYCLTVLNTLPDSALVLHGGWDIQSPFLYLQKVEGVRPDLTMLDINLMQRPWYIKQERRAHPEIFVGCDDAVNRFLQAVKPFEDRKPFDPRYVENAFVDMNDRIIEMARHKRPVYVRDAHEVGHPGIAAGFPAIPGGYFMRITESPTREFIVRPEAVLQSAERFSIREGFMLDQLSRSAVLQGRFAHSAGDTATLRSTMNVVRAIGRDNRITRDFLADAENTLAGAPGVRP